MTTKAKSTNKLDHVISEDNGYIINKARASGLLWAVENDKSLALWRDSIKTQTNTTLQELGLPRIGLLVSVDVRRGIKDSVIFEKPTDLIGFNLAYINQTDNSGEVLTHHISLAGDLHKYLRECGEDNTPQLYGLVIGYDFHAYDFHADTTYSPHNIAVNLELSPFYTGSSLKVSVQLTTLQDIDVLGVDEIVPAFKTPY